MSGKSDEENFGFTYEQVELVHKGITENIDPATIEKIEKRISSMSWKAKLLNLPCFIPSIKMM
jgi:NAD+ synthase